MGLKQFGPYTSSKLEPSDTKIIRIDFFANNGFYVIELRTFDKNVWQQGYSDMNKADAGCSDTFETRPFEHVYQTSNTLSSSALVYMKQADDKVGAPKPVDYRAVNKSLCFNH